jgi:hypothetical protein
LSNWLFGVAYRVARRARTNSLRRRSREVTVAHLEAPVYLKISMSDELGMELDRELHRLPQKYREPIILCHLEGLTHGQAAVQLDCPVGTIRSRLARGRELLRKRLTRRGYAPTAALLGQASLFPAKLISESVPTSLVAATVEAAVATTATQTVTAGAVSASAIALTQGVLTTMKIAQLKIVALAILATGVSAGGLLAVSYGAGKGPKTAPDANGGTVSAAAPQEKTFVAAEGVALKQPAMEERLKTLESKLDQLLSRSQPVTAPSVNSSSRERDPLQSNRALTNRDDDARKPSDPERRSIPELEVALKQALLEDENSDSLFKQNVISSREREKYRLEVLLIKAMLEGRDEELADEIERLKLEIRTKQAVREKAIAQTEVAASVVARNTRLNERKAGMVSSEDTARGEWEMKLASAQVATVDAEIAEVELRVRQLARRRTRIGEIIKLAG